MKTKRSIPSLMLNLCLVSASFVVFTETAWADNSDAMSRRAEMLKSADSNGDGMLTTAELSATLTDRFGKMDRNGDGFASIDDAPKIGRNQFLSRVTPIIEERDTNGDKKLSYAEFSAQPLENFNLADTDQDGKVELSALLNKIESNTN